MEGCRFLRPCLRASVRGKSCATHARFFAANRRLILDEVESSVKPGSKSKKPAAKSDFERRIDLLESRHGGRDFYPRFEENTPGISSGHIDVVKKLAETLKVNATLRKQTYALSGRVKTIRAASSKLLFIEVERRARSLQVVCNLGSMHQESVTDAKKDTFRKSVRRGDWITVTGYPYKTLSGEPSLLCNDIPKIDSPSLHQVPITLDDAETRARKPHVGMLVDPKEIQTQSMRSRIEEHLITFFIARGFSKVNTPILGPGAGGATAGPFETVASELPDTKLNLRIAPELWLKRLIIGGMDKVFELGPAFRNEGVDSSHNPEFTMCEFYASHVGIDVLTHWTEMMLHDLFKAMAKLRPQLVSHLPDSIVYRSYQNTILEPFFPETFERYPFIPTLQQAMQKTLPDLASSNARQEILSMMTDLNVPVPANQSLPNLLDALSSHFIEPLCQAPSYITEHPAALSPLAKSYTCPRTGQLVSARAELFIAGREYANMYEEENSPFEQRRKFEQQLAYRREVEPDCEAEIDESYLEALEWGLPPTGGWGMGIDRLVMLFTGRKRIGDVLPFGTLRNVVGMRGRWRGA
ncbi:Lysine--tRNA ligase, mitochondrial [Sphaceloma murrayae]|uniref:Lysine--tRNA ligase, mitochondrial n=1 Tax=Sphaceloma murrayae TaxID=2082308 RepID=A0A2K1QQK9_9PEZI|nr:Lysine--tRNA ligase, mitochondrial [Sphaceloma murrayae]